MPNSRAAGDPHRRQRLPGGAHLHAQRLVRPDHRSRRPQQGRRRLHGPRRGRKEIAALAAGLLVLSLLLFSLLGPLTLGLSLAIAILSALYSLAPFNWKGRPLLNSAAHLAGGALHFLLGYSVWSTIDRRGLAIATFFALTFAAGHLTQEIRDHQGDVLNGSGPTR